MHLGGGRTLPFRYSMIVPPFTGVDVVRQTEGLANPMGFIPVDSQYRHVNHPDVFAAGVDIAIPPPGETPVPAGVPKTGHMSERMAMIAAHNIAADVEGGEHEELALADLAAVCVLDAGNNGVIFKADHVLGDSKHPRIMAGPQAHWAKLAFERLFLETRKRGVLVG
jgi:sulfide:quinone oxidoreductase